MNTTNTAHGSNSTEDSDRIRDLIDELTHRLLPKVGQTLDTRERARAQVEIANFVISLVLNTPSTGTVPIAYLKQWVVSGQPRERVDLSEKSEGWLEAYNPIVIPLGAIGTAEIISND